MRIVEVITQPFDGAAVFTDWSDFWSKLESSNATSIEHLAVDCGIDLVWFEKIKENALGFWKESPSQSLLQGINNIYDHKPKVGQQIFPNLLWQTRFLEMCKRHALMNMFDLSKTTEQVAGQRGWSVRSPEKLNLILQVIYLIRFWNHRKSPVLKIPKIIYRGIRAGDMYDHPFVQERMKTVTSDVDYNIKSKILIETVIEAIITHGIVEMSDSSILACTASLGVAEYFANGRGFILQVDPSKVKVISSEKHDPDYFGEKDYVSNKNEREYIVHFPLNFRPKREDFIISSKEYFLAINSPLAVALLDHDDVEADYILDGNEIRARYVWNSSGTSGRLSFNYLSRSEFKKTHGFDPLPTQKNLHQITEFSWKNRKMW